jgi:hypothetical protein
MYVTSISNLIVDKMSVDGPPVNEISVDKMPVNEMSLDQKTWKHLLMTLSSFIFRIKKRESIRRTNRPSQNAIRLHFSFNGFHSPATYAHQFCKNVKNPFIRKMEIFI